MRSFHGKQEIKDFYIKRVHKHFLADEIVKGIYWEKGRGCGTGCTIHGSDHNKYETELGIPTWLAKVEDKIFEGLPDDRSKLWPQEFLEAIPIGRDLNKIKTPFLVFVLKSTLDNFNHQKYPKVLESIQNVITLYENEETDLDKFRDAYAAADAAAAAAADAASSYATTSYASAAAAAFYASYAAAAATAFYASAAAAADTAAAAAASSASFSYAAAATAFYASAAAAARRNAYIKFADELLRLLREAE